MLYASENYITKFEIFILKVIPFFHQNLLNALLTITSKLKSAFCSTDCENPPWVLVPANIMYSRMCRCFPTTKALKHSVFWYWESCSRETHVHWAISIASVTEFLFYTTPWGLPIAHMLKGATFTSFLALMYSVKADNFWGISFFAALRTSEERKQ